MAFLEENGRIEKFVPRHKQRPASPVVMINRPKPSGPITDPRDLPAVTLHWKVRDAAHIKATGQPLTPEAVIKHPIVVERGLRVPLAPNGKPMVRNVIAATISASGLSHQMLVGPLRTHGVLVWRMAAMYMARERCGASFPEIGRHFHRDHSTVMHSCRHALHRPLVRAAIELIRDHLK